LPRSCSAGFTTTSFAARAFPSIEPLRNTNLQLHYGN
jgi:hypothetical protein